MDKLASVLSSYSSVVKKADDVIDRLMSRTLSFTSCITSAQAEATIKKALANYEAGRISTNDLKAIIAKMTTISSAGTNSLKSIGSAQETEAGNFDV